jgi:hypothetical protein
MTGKAWRVWMVGMLFTLVALVGARAQDGKATDEGKAEDFKGKTFEIKAKDKAAVRLDFPADKKALVTVKSTGKSDVNLFVYNTEAKKLVAKDDSPGPDCEVSFTLKAAAKLTLVIRNAGPDDTKSTLKVEFPK